MDIFELLNTRKGKTRYNNNKQVISPKKENSITITITITLIISPFINAINVYTGLFIKRQLPH